MALRRAPVPDRFRTILAKKFATRGGYPPICAVRGRGLRSSARNCAKICATWNSALGRARRASGRLSINPTIASRTSMMDCLMSDPPSPPGQKLAPQRQLFEEMILVLDAGSTAWWNDEGQAHQLYSGRPRPHHGLPQSRLTAWHPAFQRVRVQNPADYRRCHNCAARL